MGFREGVKLTPPSISWFSSTPAGIGLSSKVPSSDLTEFIIVSTIFGCTDKRIRKPDLLHFQLVHLQLTIFGYAIRSDLRIMKRFLKGGGRSRDYKKLIMLTQFLVRRPHMNHCNCRFVANAVRNQRYYSKKTSSIKVGKLLFFNVKRRKTL